MPRRRNAALALVVLFVACTSSGSTPSTSHHPVRPRHLKKLAKGATTTPIKHVVFIVKENRSFDSLFGRFPGADGTRVGKLGTHTIPLRRASDQRLPHDLPHDRIAALKEWDHGR